MRNVNARRAIWAALDRQAIAEAHGGSLFAAPMTHFIYPGVIGYEQAGGASGPRVDYNANVHGDLSVARKYMRLAGYPSGRYTGSATIQIVAQMVLTGPWSPRS
jgi:peptide/nickel transport system substrate-binding protein